MSIDKDSGSLIDLEDALKRVGGNKGLYKRLLKMFVDGNHFEALNNEFQNGDIEKAATLAHTLKGVSANLSLTMLRTASTELEAKLKNGEMNSDSLAELKEVFDATLTSVNEMLSE